jgi:hypothetical protein
MGKIVEAPEEEENSSEEEDLCEPYLAVRPLSDGSNYHDLVVAYTAWPEATA